MATPEGYGESENSISNQIGTRYFYWQSEVFGELPGLIVTPGGIFDDPQDLLGIVERIAEDNKTGMTYVKFNDYVNELNQYIIEHPKHAKNAFMHLGHLHNSVNPISLRNRNKALTYYKEVADGVNNNTDLAQLYILMASCFTLENGQCNMNQIGNYHIKAANADPRFASFLGDAFLFGWGSYADLTLAAHFYAIGMNNGDHGANQKLRYIQYLSTIKNLSEQDSLAYHDFERYAYHSRITGDNDRAFTALASAANRGYTPAYDYLAQRYFNKLTNVHDEGQIRDLTFKWLRKGADEGYAPCIYSLALLVGNEVIDSLKGDVYKKDKNGNYSESDKKRCAEQSFKLLERANRMGSLLSMVEMGDRYLKGNPYGYPEKSLKSALICYTTAANCGSVEAQKRIDQIHREYEREIGEDYMKAIRDMSIQIIEYISVQVEDIFKSIESNAIFRNPRILTNTYTINNSDIDLSDDDPLFAANLAFGYKNIYLLYSNYLSEMNQMGSDLVSHNSETYQNLMRQIRTRALHLPIPMEIKQSKWENWSFD